MIHDDIEAGQLWRHKKRGTTYQVVSAHAALQCSAAPEFEAMFDDDYFVVYRSVATGTFYVRPAPEFADGRFERIVAVSAK
jgi:hypothetical protein